MKFLLKFLRFYFLPKTFPGKKLYGQAARALLRFFCLIDPLKIFPLRLKKAFASLGCLGLGRCLSPTSCKSEEKEISSAARVT
ncbi:MAG: hypothetical protein CRN43_00940 [Candidatus Nephrothrix sp. EaCA]|nr:MAG: hypothetical protein CRN43_00940 [Candidatus Nephrothrix sp. EaCA]